MEKYIVVGLQPYFDFLRGGAYSLEQNFDGLHWMSTNFLVKNEAGQIVDSYWSPGEALAVPFGLLFLVFALLLPVLLSAAYSLKKAKGVLCCIAILVAPGILNVFEVFPWINYIPRKYVVGGTGTLGQPAGFIAVLLLVMLWGWALTIILYDSFKLKDSFRQWYDHIWFPTALAAAVFFVSDTGSNATLASLHKHETVIRAEASFLLKQVERYDADCSAEGLQEKISCKWANNAYSELYQIQQTIPEIFKTFGPKSTNDMYSRAGLDLTKDDLMTLRREIYEYNRRVCPVKRLGPDVRQMAKESSICQMTPIEFCSAFPEETDGTFEKTSPLDSLALSTECVIPSLVQARNSVESLLVEQKIIAESKHYRVFYFVLIAFLLGGKIANASTKLTSHDQLREEEKGRLVKVAWAGLRWLVLLTIKFLKGSFRLGGRLASRLSSLVVRATSRDSEAEK